jgi:hypothetical protein
MANKHKGGYKAYIRSSKAWYADSLKNENIQLSVGIFHEGDGTTGEFIVEWVPLGGVEKGCPKLCAFDDSWSALWECRDMLQMMKEIDDQNIQEPEFCKMLDELGYRDDTEYETPYKTKESTKNEIVEKMREGWTLTNRGTGYWLSEPRKSYEKTENIQIAPEIVSAMESESLIKLNTPCNSTIAELCEYIYDAP